MHIHWFSPLPPAHSGIADYTRHLLPALRDRAEVVLWTTQRRWSNSLKYQAEVRHFDPNAPPADLRDGAVFYNIGNNSQFHAGIWNTARQTPGFAIMHDVFMHDSVAHSYQVRQDRPAYLDMMESLYGPRARRDAGLYWDGALRMPQMGRRYTCAPYILGNGLAAIVHSRMAARTLRRELDLPVIELPLPYPARRDPAPHAGPPPWRLIVFGFLGSNRCLAETLTALAQAREPRLFELHIYGDLEDRAPVYELIDRLGLQELVTVHGFVSEAELDRELAAAHLAINLRFPTKGEASYSQLRIWSHALPSLVSQIGWYGELPEGAVAFVRPGALVEDLAAHLNGYAAAPGRYIETGLAGYRYFVERHSPAKYADAIVEMARRAGEYRGRWCSALLADRAAEALSGWFDPSVFPGYTEHVAQAFSPMSLSFLPSGIGGGVAPDGARERAALMPVGQFAATDQPDDSFQFFDLLRFGGGS